MLPQIIDLARRWMAEKNILSSSFLMRRLKCSHQDCEIILKKIKNSSNNYIFIKKNILVNKDKNPYVKNSAIKKWKDVTKP